MPEIKLPTAAITFESVLYVLAFIVCLSGVIVSIVKGVEALRKVSVRDRVKTCEERLDKIEARLKLGDKRFDAQSDDLGQLLVTNHAIMTHLISGNDHEHLKAVDKELTDYMAQRATHRKPGADN